MEVDAPKGIWQQQKKEENYKRKKKEIGHNFLIDFLFFLFFIPHEKKKYLYIHIIQKNGQTAELAQDDWLEILLAEEMNVTVVVISYSCGYIGTHVKKKKNKYNFIGNFCSWFF